MLIYVVLRKLYYAMSIMPVLVVCLHWISLNNYYDTRFGSLLSLASTTSSFIHMPMAYAVVITRDIICIFMFWCVNLTLFLSYHYELLLRILILFLDTSWALMILKLVVNGFEMILYPCEYRDWYVLNGYAVRRVSK